MIIKEIEILNFRQFKTKQSIIFAEGDSNITLLLGDNTSGKTTILQAFLWCFYGSVEFASKNQLFNVENAKEMENGSSDNVAVKIITEHQGNRFVIKRTHEVHKKNGEAALVPKSNLTVSQIEDTGNTKIVKDIKAQSLINEILPEDLAPYFFYDTERFGNISGKKDLTTAVKGLLGLTVLENGLNHMGTINRKGTVLYRINRNINTKGNRELEDLRTKQEKLEIENEKNEQRLQQASGEIINYEKIVEKDKNKLKENQETIGLQKEREFLSKQLSRYETELENELKGFRNSMKINILNFYSFPIAEVVVEELSKSKFEDVGIRDMNVNSIQDLIKREKCVCGTDIIIGSSEHSELLKMKTLLPPVSIGVQVNHFLEKIKLNKNQKSTHYRSVKNHSEKISKIEQEIIDINDEYVTVSDKIKETVDGENIERRIRDNESKIRNLEQTIGRLRSDTIRNNQIVASLRDEYNNLIVKNQKSREQGVLLKYGEKIKKWLQDDLDKKQISAKKGLEEKVSEYFCRIYHGDRNVTIDDSYSVTLTSKDDVITDESAGLETVKNFSFITGLVDLAKEKIEGEYSTEGAEYPLVLDAPFSNVDEKHVINISQVLPEVANQLVLIVMAKDWNYAEEKLDYRVGKKYKLVKKSETETIIEEVN